MNTFSTSPQMAISMARRVNSEAVQQTQARAIIREQRAERHASASNPIVKLARKWTRATPIISTAPETTAH